MQYAFLHQHRIDLAIPGYPHISFETGTTQPSALASMKTAWDT
jgi:hypothetical protein